jgi:nucleotide-binding universal stress UspA family protein
MSGGGPIVVGVDASAYADAAIEWAVRQAAIRHRPLRVVTAYQWAGLPGAPPLYGGASDPEVLVPRKLAEQVMADGIDKARQLGPGVEVSGEAIDDDAVSALVEESARASMLVLGSRQLGAVASYVLGSVSGPVTARSACPTVVVRGPAGLPDESPSVIAGIDAKAGSDAVLQFAFDYASRNQRPLRAVFCWHLDPLAVMAWRSEPSAPAAAEAWLAEALAGWQEKYPDVLIRHGVLRDHPVAGLIGESLSQELLVVGRHGRHPVASAMLGSVSQGVLHHASCPVAVVPIPED